MKTSISLKLASAATLLATNSLRKRCVRAGCRRHRPVQRPARGPRQGWTEAFTKDTGIKVTVRNGGDMQLANQIIQEGDASPADVFLTENSPAMALVGSAGLFARVDKETLAQVPEQFRPADGTWTGIGALGRVRLRQEQAHRRQAAKSILDLADPAWKGRWVHLSVAPISRRSSARCCS